MTAVKTKAPKKETNKTAETTVQKAQEGAATATRSVDDIFGKLKTHFEKEKVDTWQKKWLAVPENRKKYDKLIDAPVVVGEEMMAISNDIIDFIQGQETGQSHVISKLKNAVHSFFTHPVQSVQQGVATAKETATTAKEKAEKGVNMAKETAQTVQKGAATVKEKAEKANPAAKKPAKKASKPAKK